MGSLQSGAQMGWFGDAPSEAAGAAAVGRAGCEPAQLPPLSGVTDSGALGLFRAGERQAKFARDGRETPVRARGGIAVPEPRSAR